MLNDFYQNITKRIWGTPKTKTNLLDFSVHQAKIESIIQSCRNLEQIEFCENMVESFLNSIADIESRNFIREKLKRNLQEKRVRSFHF